MPILTNPDNTIKKEAGFVLPHALESFSQAKILLSKKCYLQNFDEHCICLIKYKRTFCIFILISSVHHVSS